MSDEMLFYGGLGMIAVTLAAAIAVVCILGIKKRRLKLQLDAEYGEKNL